MVAHHQLLARVVAAKKAETEVIPSDIAAKRL